MGWEGNTQRKPEQSQPQQRCNTKDKPVVSRCLSPEVKLAEVDGVSSSRAWGVPSALSGAGQEKGCTACLLYSGHCLHMMYGWLQEEHKGEYSHREAGQVPILDRGVASEGCSAAVSPHWGCYILLSHTATWNVKQEAAAPPEPGSAVGEGTSQNHVQQEPEVEDHSHHTLLAPFFHSTATSVVLQSLLTMNRVQALRLR